jgi:hypothetical protein
MPATPYTRVPARFRLQLFELPCSSGEGFEHFARIQTPDGCELHSWQPTGNSSFAVLWRVLREEVPAPPAPT